MPEKEQESVAALMDRVLEDIDRNERIARTFTLPLQSMAYGIRQLDKRFDQVEHKVDLLGKEMGQVQDDVNVIKAWTERIGRYIERDEPKADQGTT